MNNTITFKIHYDGDYSDEIIISGESIEDIRQAAFAECEKRGWDAGKCWSERIRNTTEVKNEKEKAELRTKNGKQ